MSASAQVGWMDRLKIMLVRAKDEGEHLLQGAEADLMRFIEELKLHVAEHPEPIFAILRDIKPVLVVKNFALVARFADVQEVLARDDVFQVTYGPGMEAVTGGQNFFLGMQNSPAYERDVTNMRMAMRREDVGRIAAFVAQTAGGLVAASGGKIDVVALGRTVPVRWIGSYFGTPAESEQELADWATVIFQFLFADLTHDPAVGAAALAAAAKLRPWLDGIIALRKAHTAQADDLLGRCLALQSLGLPGLDDVSIRNNFIGLIAGAIPTTSKCCAQAMDELLKRPAALAAAQEAARAGNDPLLAQYVFEALRFNPNNPGLFRMTAADYTVARSQSHATLIPKGTTVLAATQSAMFDGRVIDSPNDFLPSRPDYGSMHFGYGLHSCFGQHVNRVQIPGILKPLLQRNGLRRAAGSSGQLQRTGPFPSTLAVEF